VSHFICALGLLFVFEGIPYFASPRVMKRIVARLPMIPDATLRALGLAAMGAGLTLVYLSQKGL